MMPNIYYVDGEYVPADKAMIPVDDLAVVRGIGVFDLLRTYNGKPYFLEEHVKRLFRSAQEINLAMPWSQDDICAVALEALNRNKLDEASVRIIVTGGSSPDFMTPKGKPRLIVLVTPLPKLPHWWYTKGVKVTTFQADRNLPNVKSIDYQVAALALEKARQEDAIEAIYLDSEGLALEGTTSNLFAFIRGRLVTPGRKVLSGITRNAVLTIAQDQYSIAIRDLHKAELKNAQEVFITGTNKGLVPVIQVDHSVIGNGRPGPKTLKMMALLERYIQKII